MTVTDEPKLSGPLGPGVRCECVKYHNPNPMTFQKHHILPKSWGGKDRPDNYVFLCGTAHDNVHTLLNEYVRHRGVPPSEIRSRYSPYIRRLAQRAWDERPSDTPPWTVTKVD